jgi:hypothetical protein
MKKLNDLGTVASCTIFASVHRSLRLPLLHSLPTSALPTTGTSGLFTSWKVTWFLAAVW